MNKLRYILLPLLTAVICLCQACGSDDDEPSLNIPSSAVYDFVTIVESSSKGSVFEMRKADDSPVIRYTSNYDLASSSTHVSVGDRVIICYTRIGGEIYTSGQIRLFAYATLSNTELQVLTGNAADYDSWASPPVTIQALWRSGEYINMQALLYGLKDIHPDKFVLVADLSTLGLDFPTLYVVYANREGNDGPNQYTANASFDISRVWSLPSCKGVTISYPTRKDRAEVTFVK